ncbi:hypothetical protein NL676_010665 [Syzygium grande]|nr:hypothetical protein NL676_010665 [Syzygium grande]
MPRSYRRTQSGSAVAILAVPNWSGGGAGFLRVYGSREMSVVTGGGGGGNGKVEAWDSSESMGRKKKKSSDGGERKSVYFSSVRSELIRTELK